MAETTPAPAGALPSGHPLTEAARQWLAALQRCVRAVDYEGAQALVDPDVLAFGTYASIVGGRSALRREQWERVWPAIREFTFRLFPFRDVLYHRDYQRRWTAAQQRNAQASPDQGAVSPKIAFF